MKRFMKLTLALVAILAVACFSVACDGSTPSKPSVKPSVAVSATPSTTPSAVPSATPSAQPSVTPSTAPSTGTNPSVAPSTGTQPSVTPSAAPSTAPSAGSPSQTAGVVTEAQFYAALEFMNVTGLTVNMSTVMPEVQEESVTPVFTQATVSTGSDVTLYMNGNKLKIVSPASTFPMIFESAEGALYFYADMGEEEMGALRADVIGMIEDPVLAEMVNEYLGVDYGAMLIAYAAEFEDEGFSIQSYMQEIKDTCASVDYDLKALVHALMEAYGLEEPDIAEFFEGVDLGEMLTAMGVPTDAAQAIVDHFEENGFNLDALLDLIVIYGFDLETVVTDMDEFLASLNYSLEEIAAYLVEYMGMTEATLGEWLGMMLGLEAGEPFTYEMLLEMLALDSVPSVNWVDFALEIMFNSAQPFLYGETFQSDFALETMFDYADYTFTDGAYLGEMLLDPTTGLTVTETLRFAEGNLAYYAVTFTLDEQTFGTELTFSDYNETEVTLPTEYTEVTLEDLFVLFEDDFGASGNPSYTTEWTSAFLYDSATVDIDVTVDDYNYSLDYYLIETMEGWYFTASEYALEGVEYTNFVANGDWESAYVDGVENTAAADIPYSYNAIFTVLALCEEDFIQIDETTYTAELISEYYAENTTLSNVTVEITDGEVSAISYDLLLSIPELELEMTQHWAYEITNFNCSTLPQ